MFCKSCGNKLDDDALFCMNCGVKISDTVIAKYCAHCGIELEDDAVFCMGCGNRINEEQTQTETENKVESESVKVEKTAEQDAQNNEPLSDVGVEKAIIEKETVVAPVLTEMPQKEKTESRETPEINPIEVEYEVSQSSPTMKNEFFIVAKDLKKFAAIRGGNTSNYYCPNCHTQVSSSSDSCRKCGVSFYNWGENKSLNGNAEKTSEKFAESKKSSEKTGIHIVDVMRENASSEKEVSEGKALKNAESTVQESQQNLNNSVNENSDSLDEKSESIEEYTDISVNGRHFLYLDDSRKVFCPKCKKRVDSASTVCSWCNTSFMTDANEKSNNNSSMSQPIVSERFENMRKESTYSTTNSATRGSEKNYGLLIAVIFIVVAIFAGLSISENNKKSVQTSTSNGVSNTNTFNFDHLKPYTFKSNDGSYEYDCYSLSKGTLVSLWNNPPRYFTYNTKKYEVDNRNIDYDEDYDGDYNVIIYWGDYDGTYYHFLGVEIINGNKGMWLWKL